MSLTTLPDYVYSPFAALLDNGAIM